MKHYSPDNHQRMGESHCGELGFTLMETTIALLILMVVGLGAASLFFYAATNTSTASDRQLAMAVAQQRIAELEQRTADALDRIAWAVDSLHNCAEDE